jgi:hypothetical protein
MHRLVAVLAGLWLLVLVCAAAYSRLARARALARPRHRLARALAADTEGFWSPGFWVELLGHLKAAAFLFGPPAAIYVLGWSLVSPTVWIVRGFGRAGGRI